MTHSDDHPADTLREWLSTYISTMHDEDLDIITLWILHTHFVPVLYTTGRLLLDSPVPESGKTTVLEHMSHLALDPVQASSISSEALIPRMLDIRPRTILIDEADRALSPDNPNNKGIISTVNSGYKRGGTRPVLMKTADGSWEPSDMSTFGAVAMAGNNPDLAPDTRSRTIRVLLMPDTMGTVEDSDWEFIEADAKDLLENISQWAEANHDRLGEIRPPMPEGIRGRLRECWSPIIRVAALCGPEWQERAMHLARRALELRRAEVEAGLASVPPKTLMLKAMYDNWPEGQERWKTEDIIPMLAAENPTLWEADLLKNQKRVTAQAIGKTLAGSFGLHTRRGTTRSDRTPAYHRSDFIPVFLRMGISPLSTPDTPDTSVTPDTSSEANVTGVDGMAGVSGLQGVGEDAMLEAPEPPSMVWGQRPEPVDPDPDLFGNTTPAKPLIHRIRILAYLAEHGPADLGAIADATDKVRGATSSNLTRLKNDGEVEQPEERGPYSITEAGHLALAEATERKAS